MNDIELSFRSSSANNGKIDVILLYGEASKKSTLNIIVRTCFNNESHRENHLGNSNN